MPPASRNQTVLQGLSVLTLGDAVSVRCAASWLAECGADVAAFHPERRPPAEATAEGDFDHQVARAVRTANFDDDAPFDIVIADSAACTTLGALVPAGLTARAVTIEVTSPLDAAANFDEALINDMVLWLRSGLGYLTREIDADWQLGRPCIPLNRQASILAGIAAATAAVAVTLAEDTATPAPRRIEIDQLELLALLPMQPIAFAQLEGRIVGKQQHPPAPRFPGGTVPAANGMAYLRPVEPAHWAGLLRLIGGLDPIAERIEEDPGLLLEAGDAIDARIRAWALALTAEEISDRCQAAHIPAAPVYRPDQVVRDAHLAARSFFRDAAQGGGLNLPWLASLGAAPPTSAPGHTAKRGTQRGIRTPAAHPDAGLPLAGLRILDLSWAWAGPFATTLLADLGAEVINVEWRPRASNLRRNAPFAGGRRESNNTGAWWSANQRGKLSIGVDMKTPAGKDIIRALAASSDAVVENFSPGTVDRLGVGFQDLVKANPCLVYVSLSAFGQTGPRSHYIGYGTQVFAAAGAGYATSQDGHTLSQMYIPYPDPVSGLGGAFAIASHVRHARATGRPAHVDVSELEVVASVTMEPLLQAGSGGEAPAASGDDSSGHRYLIVAAADDGFAALLARTPDDWIGFQRALGATDVTPEALRAAAARHTVAQSVEYATAANLLAVPVQDSAAVLDDPYLAERGFWIADESPEVAASAVRIGGSVWRVDGRRAPVWRGAPPLFADTRNILEGLLDYSADAVDDLIKRGVVA